MQTIFLATSVQSIVWEYVISPLPFMIIGCIYLLFMEKGRRQGKYAKDIIGVEIFVGILLVINLIFLAVMTYQTFTAGRLFGPRF